MGLARRRNNQKPVSIYRSNVQRGKKIVAFPVLASFKFIFVFSTSAQFIYVENNEQVNHALW